MISQFPMIPVFYKKQHIKNQFFSCEGIIENKENSVFKIELIGAEELIDDYINNLVIIDIKLSFIEDEAFNKLMKNKALMRENSLNLNDFLYKCQGDDLDAGKFNDLLKNSDIDSYDNFYNESILNINLVLLKENGNWNFFYFEIDPSISIGAMHIYKQKFSDGEGFVDMDVSGGECGLGINTTNPFGYFTRQNDCQPVNWTASSSYQRIYICSNKDGSNYTISGGWKRTNH